MREFRSFRRTRLVEADASSFRRPRGRRARGGQHVADLAASGGASNAARRIRLAERLLDRARADHDASAATCGCSWNMFWIATTTRIPGCFADADAPIDAADQAPCHRRRPFLRIPTRTIASPPAVRRRDSTGTTSSRSPTHWVYPVRYEPHRHSDVRRPDRHGGSAHFVQHISNVAQDYRDGVFAGVNNLVEVIGGVKPITVEDYVAATRSRFDTTGRPRRSAPSDYAPPDTPPPNEGYECASATLSRRSRALMRRRSVRNRQNFPVFMANPTSSAISNRNPPWKIGTYSQL